MPKVSVIVPIYNKASYLNDSIGSILCQSFSDFELLVIDDGSTDGSGEILDRIAASDDRVRVNHKPNGGVSAARNTALDMASGEYIVFADGDDTVCPDWLARLYQAITESKADIVISGLTKVNAQGDLLCEVAPPCEETLSAKELYCRFSEFQGNRGMLGFCVGKMFSRKLALDNTIRFDEGLKLAEDLDFFMRLYEKAESIRFIRYAGYRYLQEAENSAVYTSAYNIDYISQLRIWERIRTILQSCAEYNKKNQAFVEDRFINYAYCALLYNSSSPCVSVKKLYDICGKVKVRSNATEKAFIPIAIGYKFRSDFLCRAYAYLFKHYMHKKSVMR